MEYKKAAAVGGDLRQITAAEQLMRHFETVSMYGFDTYRDISKKSLPLTLKDTDVLLLPLPVLRGDYLNTPFSEKKISVNDLISSLDKEKKPLVIGGMIPPELKDRLEGIGIEVFDLCQSERFNIMNAVPTAEGALLTAMSGMKTTLFGSKITVLGFGRIGKLLCRDLHALGASVSAVSRKESDLSMSRALGYTALDYNTLGDSLGEQDVIFNTVPSAVLGEEHLKKMKPSAFIVDLASKPGGVDMSAASRLGVRVISALSLPGKLFPVSAGRIIADCVIDRVKGVRA